MTLSHHSDPRTWCDVHVADLDTQPVVTVRGEIDLGCVDLVWDHIERACSASRRLVIDLAGVTFMDSQGIKLLLRAHQRQGSRPDAVVLRSPTRPVLETLRLCGLEQIFTVE